MKLFGFAMVKNEADIIESFVRINSRVLDEIHFIDDGSTDDTVMILENLRKEGYNITVHYEKTEGVQQQSFLLTHLVQQTHSSGWDYAVPLDADEFLIAARQDIEEDLGVLQGKMFGLFEWLTFIPVKDTQPGEPVSLHDAFKPRRKESAATYNYKVVIPRELVSDEIVISTGNHSVITQKPVRDTHTILKTRLAHIPVRSANQIIRKAVLGSHTLSIKENRLPGEGGHWDILANAIREKNFVVRFEELQALAFGYQSPFDIYDEHELLDTPLIPETGELRYTHSDDGTLKAFDDFCAVLCKKIHSPPEAPSRPDVMEPEDGASNPSHQDSLLKSVARWLKG